MASANCSMHIMLFSLVIFCLAGFLDGNGQQQKAENFPTSVFGVVFCDSCLAKNFTAGTLVIPNITASISCEGFEATNKTNIFGFFLFEIPDAITAKISMCVVKVVNDPSFVQGDFAKCNQQVEFPAVPAEEKWQPSSTPYAIQKGSPFYSVGPFMFQPPQKFSFCDKFAYTFPNE